MSDRVVKFAALVFEALHDHACVGYFDKVLEPAPDNSLRVSKNGAVYKITIERVR